MSAKFYWFNAVGLTLTAFAILILMQWYPSSDFAVLNWFYQSDKGFVYVNHWFWRDWLHEDVRLVVKPAKVVLSLFLLLVMVWPKRHRFRGAALYVFLTMLACNGVVSWLKGESSRACPSELIEYGGTYAWQPLFSAVVEKIDGECWPGGHALHAFMLLPIVFGFILLGMHRATRWSLMILLSFGFVLSVTQIVRGQHFLSHQLATLFFCWLTSLIGFVIAQQLAKARQYVQRRFWPASIKESES